MAFDFATVRTFISTVLQADAEEDSVLWAQIRRNERLAWPPAEAFKKGRRRYTLEACIGLYLALILTRAYIQPAAAIHALTTHWPTWLHASLIGTKFDPRFERLPVPPGERPVMVSIVPQLISDRDRLDIDSRKKSGLVPYDLITHQTPMAFSEEHSGSVRIVLDMRAVMKAFNDAFLASTELDPHDVQPLYETLLDRFDGAEVTTLARSDS